MESKMLEALRRYIQDYGWNWGIVHSLINRKFGTDYTLEELQHFYIRRAWLAAFAASRVLFQRGSSPGCTLPRRSRRRMIAVRER